MRATIYLTDGFDRLDLEGKETIFALEHDWTAKGQTCSWVWPHKLPSTVAGAEVVCHKPSGPEVCKFGVGNLNECPEVVHEGQTITFTPSISIDFMLDHSLSVELEVQT